MKSDNKKLNKDTSQPLLKSVEISENACALSKENPVFYKQIIAEKTRESERYYQSALGQYYLGNIDQAFADISQAIELDSSFALAYQQRATFYFNQGAVDLALNDYTKAIELDANDALSWQYRGYAYLEIHDYTAAIEDLTQTLELEPNCSDCYAYRGLAKAYYWTEQSALEDYNRALELNPESTLALSLRSDLLAAMNQYQEAQNDLKQALYFDKTNLDYNNRLIALKSAVNLNAKLFEAVKAGDIHEVASLLKQGADIDVRDAQDNSLLVYALALEEVKSLKMIQLLIKNQIRARSISNQKESVLVRAAYLNNLEVVSWLLQTLNWRHNEKMPALAVAVNEGHIEVTKEILSYIHETFCGELIDQINQMDGAISGHPPVGIDLKELKWACQLRVLASYWRCLKWGVQANAELIQSAGNYILDLILRKENQQLIDTATAWITGMLVWKRIGERLKGWGRFPEAQGEIIASSEQAEAFYTMYSPAEYKPNKAGAHINDKVRSATPVSLAKQSSKIYTFSDERPELITRPDIANNLLLGVVLAKLTTQVSDKITQQYTCCWQKKTILTAQDVTTAELEQAQASFAKLETRIDAILSQPSQDKWYIYGLEDLRDELNATNIGSLSSAKVKEWQEELGELEAEYALVTATPVFPVMRMRSNGFFQAVKQPFTVQARPVLVAEVQRQIAA